MAVMAEGGANLPAVVVVTVNVEDLLALDTENTRENALSQACDPEEKRAELVSKEAPLGQRRSRTDGTGRGDPTRQSDDAGHRRA